MTVAERLKKERSSTDRFLKSLDECMVFWTDSYRELIVGSFLFADGSRLVVRAYFCLGG